MRNSIGLAPMVMATPRILDFSALSRGRYAPFVRDGVFDTVAGTDKREPVHWTMRVGALPLSVGCLLRSVRFAAACRCSPPGPRSEWLLTAASRRPPHRSGSGSRSVSPSSADRPRPKRPRRCPRRDRWSATADATREWRAGWDAAASSGCGRLGLAMGAGDSAEIVDGDAARPTEARVLTTYHVSRRALGRRGRIVRPVSAAVRGGRPRPANGRVDRRGRRGISGNAVREGGRCRPLRTVSRHPIASTSSARTDTGRAGRPQASSLSPTGSLPDRFRYAENVRRIESAVIRKPIGGTVDCGRTGPRRGSVGSP